MALRSYLATEVALDHADGLLSRREALHRLGLLGLTTVAASGLLSACADAAPAPAAPSPAPAAATPDYDVAAATARTEAITFPGGTGTMSGAFAAAQNPKGAVLVVHENRGLTDHIRSVAGRLAASGYSALAIDLLSEEGGTAKFTDPAQATAALNAAPPARFVADMKAGVDELLRRVPAKRPAAMGFCFGGGMVWQLLAAGEPRLGAAAPFYGPLPDGADLSGSKGAAVLAIYGELDTRVNASRDAAKAALDKAGLKHEIVTYPGANHAFFNDTGERYNATAAAQVYQRLIEWFTVNLA
jgi:carboxymethylenebutenolidase